MESGKVLNILKTKNLLITKNGYLIESHFSGVSYDILKYPRHNYKKSQSS